MVIPRGVYKPLVIPYGRLFSLLSWLTWQSWEFLPTKINAYVCEWIDDGCSQLFSVLASNNYYCYPADGVFDANILLSHAINFVQVSLQIRIHCSLLHIARTNGKCGLARLRGQNLFSSEQLGGNSTKLCTHKLSRCISTIQEWHKQCYQLPIYSVGGWTGGCKVVRINHYNQWSF